MDASTVKELSNRCAIRDGSVAARASIRLGVAQRDGVAVVGPTSPFEILGG